jgi:hypothetical protein
MQCNSEVHAIALAFRRMGTNDGLIINQRLSTIFEIRITLESLHTPLPRNAGTWAQLNPFKPNKACFFSAHCPGHHPGPRRLS